MRYNKNRLKEIDKSIEFFNSILNLLMDRLEIIRMTYIPCGYPTGISYNDFDNVQNSKKQIDIFQVTKEISDIKNKIENTKDIIKSYDEEKKDIGKYIRIIQETTSDKVSLKEKIVKLNEIHLSKTEISEVLDCSYRYVVGVIA